MQQGYNISQINIFSVRCCTCMVWCCW